MRRRRMARRAGAQLGALLYKTLFEEAEELRGMFFNLSQARLWGS